MLKKFIIRDSAVSTKIKTICAIKGIHLSETEIVALESLILFSDNGSLGITPLISKQIRCEMGITSSALNTAIFRLTEKGAINKQGRTVIISPVFNNIDSLTGVLINFSPAT